MRNRLNNSLVYPELGKYQQNLTADLVNDPNEKVQVEQFAGWIKEFHRWKEIYVSEFKIELPPVAFCIKSTWSNCYGYFRPGINEFGLIREIAVNKIYLTVREPWEVLGTLLHELLHAWQDAFGKPGKRNYHNEEFRKKAKEFGLLVESTGVTDYALDSPFKKLLRKYGVTVPDAPPAVPPAPVRGKSTLNKWVCGCDRPVCLRVGRAEVNVQCLDCGTKFVREEG